MKDIINSDEILSAELDLQANEILLPDESMQSQSGDWSMKSYPVNPQINNKSLFNSSGSAMQENSEGNESKINYFINLDESNSKSSTYSQNNSRTSKNYDESMPAPPQRKRKRYANPGKASRKRKRK